MQSKVKFIMVGGPTGIGKTTITNHLLSQHSILYRPRTYTTRQPRDSDLQGQFEYLSIDQFQKLKNANYFVQVDQVLGNWYAMAISDFSTSHQNSIPIKEIHFKDHQSFKEHLPNAISVLLTSSDWSTFSKKTSNNSNFDAARKQRVEQEIDYHTKIKNPELAADIVLINNWQDTTINLANILWIRLQKIL